MRNFNIDEAQLTSVKDVLMRDDPVLYSLIKEAVDYPTTASDLRRDFAVEITPEIAERKIEQNRPGYLPPDSINFSHIAALFYTHA